MSTKLYNLDLINFVSGQSDKYARNKEHDQNPVQLLVDRIDGTLKKKQFGKLCILLFLSGIDLQASIYNLQWLHVRQQQQICLQLWCFSCPLKAKKQCAW